MKEIVEKEKDMKELDKKFGHIVVRIAVIILVVIWVGSLGFGIWGVCVVTAKSETVIVNESENEVHDLTVEQVKATLEDVAYLTVQRSDYNAKVSTDNVKTFGDSDLEIPLTKTHIELECPGRVYVSYDLSAIYEEIEVDNENLKIRIKLPEPEVISNDIILEGVVCIDENNNVFNFNRLDDYLNILEEAKEKGLQQAIDNGLYKNAEKNAQSQLTGFLAIFSDYEVEFV